MIQSFSDKRKKIKIASKLIANLLLMGPLLTGCGINIKEIGAVPVLSPVHADLGYDEQAAQQAAPEQNNYSLYNKSSNNFFKDPRAMRAGDILTVLISINDRANLNNRSDLKKDSDANYGAGVGSSLFKNFNANLSGSTAAHAKGDARIQRNEDIRLSVAAVITKVLPNGNLVIEGSQEIRVNYELRVFNVAGVVRPRDISGNNTIAYDKIAEARVSYGGRGRMSEIQQPPYGQQILNKSAPF